MTVPWCDALDDVTWIDTEEGILLVTGRPAGTHIRAATDLEKALRPLHEHARSEAENSQPHDGEPS